MTLPSFFSNMPNELFLPITVGDLTTRLPSSAISTLCQWSAVSKAVKAKVDSCWEAFVTYLGKDALLMNQREWENANKDYNLLKERFRSMVRWDTGTPVVVEQYLQGYMGQAITQRFGDLELSMVCTQRDGLCQINLASRELSALQFSQKLNPISYGCSPCMVSSDKEIAICCNNLRERCDEIVIIERASGKEIQKIRSSEGVRHICWDQQFLYVLFVNTLSGEAKIGRFDSYSWGTPAKELPLPVKNVATFVIDGNHLLFWTTPFLRPGRLRECCQLWAIQQDAGFESSVPQFISGLFTCEPGFSANNSPPSPEKLAEKVNKAFISSVWHEDSYAIVSHGKLYLISQGGRTIDYERPQRIYSVSVKDSSIFTDFLIEVVADRVDEILVQNNRLFILQKNKFSIACFDLFCGRRIGEFSSKVKESSPTTLHMQLLATKTRQITLIFSTAVRLRREEKISLRNLLMTLDF